MTYLSFLALTLIHRPLLNTPDPVRECRIQDEVHGYSGCGVDFCGVPAELPVEVEECSCNENGGVAEEEANVGFGVDLAEAEVVEVGGDVFVGGVFEVCEGIKCLGFKERKGRGRVCETGKEGKIIARDCE